MQNVDVAQFQQNAIISDSMSQFSKILSCRVFRCHVCDKESVRRYAIANHIGSAHGEWKPSLKSDRNLEIPTWYWDHLMKLISGFSSKGASQIWGFSWMDNAPYGYLYHNLNNFFSFKQYYCGQLWVRHMFCGRDLWWTIPLHIFHWSCWDTHWIPKNH